MGRKAEKSIFLRREKERKRLEKLECLLDQMRIYEPASEEHNNAVCKNGEGAKKDFLCYYTEKSMKKWLTQREIEGDQYVV